MKVIILAGGKGSRISYYTQKIPKPMIKIGGSPILSHIMRIFKYYGGVVTAKPILFNYPYICRNY